MQQLEPTSEEKFEEENVAIVGKARLTDVRTLMPLINLLCCVDNSNDAGNGQSVRSCTAAYYCLLHGKNLL